MTLRRLNANNQGLEDTARVYATITSLASGGVPPVAVTVGYSRGYAYTIADTSFWTVPVPADWEPASLIGVGVRWACNENYALANGEVQWRVDYETIANNGTQVVGAGTTGNVSSGDIDIPTLARQLQESAIGNIVAANLAAGDTIAIQLQRIALTAGVNPTAEPEVYSLYIQYTRYIQTN